MYARKIGDKKLTFDFAEGLIKNNLLFVDRETHTIWSQLAGQAVSGKLKGEPLKMLPTMQTTWKFWKSKHPDTRVLVEKGKKGYPYVYRTWQPGEPRPEKRPTQHNTSTLGLGIVINGEGMFFPFTELARQPRQFPFTIGGKTVTIHYDPDGLTAWATGANGKLLTTVLAYKTGWFNFNPKSKIFHVGSGKK